MTGYKKVFERKELKKMSLQLVSDLSNETETIVDVDGNLWFKRAHVGKYLDIKDIKHNFKDFLSHYTHCSFSTCSLKECEMSTRNAIRPGPRIRKINVIFFY